MNSGRSLPNREWASIEKRIEEYIGFQAPSRLKSPEETKEEVSHQDSYRSSYSLKRSPEKSESIQESENGHSVSPFVLNNSTRSSHSNAREEAFAMLKKQEKKLAEKNELLRRQRELEAKVWESMKQFESQQIMMKQQIQPGVNHLKGDLPPQKPLGMDTQSILSPKSKGADIRQIQASTVNIYLGSPSPSTVQKLKPTVKSRAVPDHEEAGSSLERSRRMVKEQKSRLRSIQREQNLILGMSLLHRLMLPKILSLGFSKLRFYQVHIEEAEAAAYRNRIMTLQTKVFFGWGSIRESLITRKHHIQSFLRTVKFVLKTCKLIILKEGMLYSLLSNALDQAISWKNC
jgi:hypothetical protein